MSISCAISGEIPDEPVVSHVSGHIFERRLIEKWIEDKGTDPVNNEPLSIEQVTPIKNADTVIRPRAPAWTSIPGILKALQDEWDALMLHQYSLREQLQNTRQELSHTLYQHDAACRVIARLQRETAEAKEALSTLRPSGDAPLIKESQKLPSAAEIEAMKNNPIVAEEIVVGQETPAEGENRALTSTVIDEILKTNEELTKERKIRSKNKNAFPDVSTQDEIVNFGTAKEFSSFHSTAYPGILDMDINENLMPGHILTSGFDKQGVLFNTEDESIVQVLKGHSKKITRGIFHSTEAMAITASVDQTVKLWALNSQEEEKGQAVCLETCKIHNGTVAGLSLHPVGKYILTAGYDGVWNFLDLPSSTVLTRVTTPDTEYNSCMVHPDGRIFATGTSNGSASTVSIWDISEREQVANFDGHNDGVISISFSDNGYFMATGSKDGTCKIWDLRKLKCRETIPIAEKAPVNVEFDPSGTYLACSAGNTVKIFTTGRQWNEITDLEGHDGTITCCKWGKNAKQLYTGAMDNSVHVFECNMEAQEAQEMEDEQES